MQMNYLQPPPWEVGRFLSECVWKCRAQTERSEKSSPATSSPLGRPPSTFCLLRLNAFAW